MPQKPEAQFPGGSKSRVNRAGDNVRKNTQTEEDLSVIEQWRAAHRTVLNTFQALLRTRTNRADIKVVHAQRHKRKRTIFDKLARLPKMSLSRMDDVAGCRLIFENTAELNSFRERFHQARFLHKRRNDPDKYNYIKSPKSTGYRGIHDVYEYDVRSKKGKPQVGLSLKGLYVEIQYRTLVQHAWATTVEVIGFITQNQPKFQQGDDRYVEAMRLASEILARAFEEAKGPFPELSDADILEKFEALDQDLGLLKTLGKLNTANEKLNKRRNTILIFSNPGELEVHTYRNAPEALKALFDFESKHPNSDVVLVKAETSDDIRLAFRNYFSDAKDFIKFIRDGCKKLSGKKQ